MNWKFWQNKAQEKTLQELVNTFTEVKEELKTLNQVTEELSSDTKVSIHYYPEKELTVYLGGDMLSSTDISKEMFVKLVEAKKVKNYELIKELILGQVPKNAEINVEQVVINTKTLVDTGDFEVKGNSVYLKGINRSLPQSMIERFIGLAKDSKEYNSLKNFWNWIVLNPNVVAAETFYDFLDKYKVNLTKEGFILAYRWVVDKGSADRELVQFVSNQWVKVKKNKKSPKNFWVWQDDDGTIAILKSKPKKKSDGLGSLLGNLDELYKNLDKYQKDTFTDQRTQTFEIKIGTEVKMNRKDTDESTNSCSRGLMCSPSTK